MKDRYGTQQVYLVQPTKLDYEIPYSDGVKTVNEGRFRTYSTCSVKGYSSGIRIQLNRIGAEEFAKYNGLVLITEEEQYAILEKESDGVVV